VAEADLEGKNAEFITPKDFAEHVAAGVERDLGDVFQLVGDLLGGHSP
jgi:hypothetical protein